LTVGATAVIVLVAVTPLSTLWLDDVMALPPHLLTLAQPALTLALLLPGLAVLQSWYQGAIVNSRRTRGVTESVFLYIVIISLIMGTGVLVQGPAGLHVTIIALEIAGVAQVIWLWRRSRSAIHALTAADATEHLGAPSPVPAE
jgi:Na+-driven multidrug efflux pump